MTVSQATEIRSTLIAMFEAIDKKENIAEHLLKLDDIQRSLDRRYASTTQTFSRATELYQSSRISRYGHFH